MLPSTTPLLRPWKPNLDNLESNPAAVRARAYDLVLNGNEIAGGSVRIHRRDIQERIFQLLGISSEESRSQIRIFSSMRFAMAPPPMEASHLGTIASSP